MGTSYKRKSALESLKLATSPHLQYERIRGRRFEYPILLPTMPHV